MIVIKFEGNSMENIIRQIVSFVEKVEVKETPRRGRHEVQQPRPVFFTEEEQAKMSGYKNRGL